VFVVYFHTHDLWECPTWRSLAVEPRFIHEPHEIEDSRMFIKKCLEPWTVCQVLLTVRVFQLMDGCDVLGMNLGCQACWLGHGSFLWQSTQGFLRRVFRLCSDACVFAQPCFMLSMKLGMCVINFMLLNVLVGKLYQQFWVWKLVGHPVLSW
jgi:hypothetical protein